MDKLNQVLQSYLTTPETDYSIMISGAWGCGKTYYINDKFEKLARETDVPGSGAKGKKCEKYIPAYISLYGVSSVVDFEYKVFCGINTWAGKQLVRVASRIGSIYAERSGFSVGKNDLKDWTVIKKTASWFLMIWSASAKTSFR